jgi:uncharacterized membrane protein
MAISAIVVFVAILFFLIVIFGAYIAYLRMYIGYREHGRAATGMRVSSEPVSDDVYYNPDDD